MEKEYTKGEWKTNSDRRDETGDWRITSNGNSIGRWVGFMTPKENKANAHLIASAPRMHRFITELANNGNTEAQGFITMQNTQSQTKREKGVGHVCSNCGQMVECDLNTDLYEACEKIALELSGYGQDAPRALVDVKQALAKADNK